MNELAAQPGAPEPAAPRPRERRSYLAKVALKVLGDRGADVGLIWIAFIAFLAVFAPLLANSHPVLLQMDDQWSSPLLRHLTAADVILLLGAPLVGTLLLLRQRLPARLRWGGGAAVLMLIVILSLVLVRPPKTVVYDQYRVAQAEGKVQFMLRTLIPYSPNDRLRDEEDSRFQPPSAKHWMGTTLNGEDLASRMIHAARIALAIGFIATGIAVVIGVVVGGLMGYFSGWVDLLGMRLVEIFSAIPTIYLLIAIVAFYGRNLYLMMVVIGLTGWVGYAIFTRAEFLRLRKQDFVQAAIACGLPLRSVLFRHMLPNGVSPVIVSASFGVASAILTESVLSFLGLGLVEEPSWGQMLNQARTGVFYWWMAIYPGMAIFLTVFAYNLVGEALRDAIDPHLKKAAHL